MDHLISAAHRGGDGATAASLAPLTLRPDVHLACIGDDAVLLDVSRDSYHGLAEGAGLCQGLERGEADFNHQALASLSEMGLLTRDARPMRPRAPPTLPSRSIIHSPAPFGVADLMPAVAAVAHVQRARRGRGLGPYLERRGRPGQHDPDGAVEAARRFWTLMPYLPI